MLKARRNRELKLIIWDVLEIETEGVEFLIIYDYLDTRLNEHFVKVVVCK